MFIKENEIGFEINSPAFFFFFGKKDSSVERIQQTYPQYSFFKTQQVHGDHFHEWTSAEEAGSVEADGQYTTLKKAALLVASADCIPVLIVHPHSMTVMGIHAGWRGIASRVIAKGLEKLFDQGAESQEIFAIIGPHIQQSSFEVGEDVKNQLLASVTNVDETGRGYIARQNDKGKFQVDLNALAKLQISQFEVPADQVFDLHLNTFTDPRFHSYRRDKENTGRQYSFVVRK
jgi:YfiH family protein